MPLDSIQVAKDTAAISNNPDFQSKPILATPDYQSFDVPSAPQKSSQNSISDLLLKIPDNVSKDTKNYANTTQTFNRNTVSNRYPQYFLGRDNEDLNAELQSTPQVWGQGAMQFIQKVPAFLGQTLGLIGGGLSAAVKGTVNLGNEALGGDGKVFNGGNAITDMTDNWLTSMSTQWHDSLADKFPIYKPAGYQESSMWHKLSTAEWWAEDGMDRFALGVATALPFAGEALLGAKLGISPLLFSATESGEETGLAWKALNAFKQSPEVLSSLGKEVGKNLFKEAAAQAGAEATSLEAGVSTGAATQTAPGRSFANWVKGLNNTEKLVISGISQSGLNAAEAKHSITQKLQEEKAQGYNAYSDDEINDIASSAARQAFWLSMPLAVATSSLELPAWFSSMRMAKSAYAKIGEETLLQDTTEKILTGLDEAAAKTVKPSLLKITGKSILQGFEHGPFNESMQVAIGRYLDDRIAGKIEKGKLTKEDGDETSLIDTIWNYGKGIGKDFFDNVNDPNGQNNIALGFLQGFFMKFGGHFYSAKTGAYTKQDEADRQYINALKQSIAQRRFFSTPEEFYQRDENGKPIIENGKPKINQPLLAQMGVSLLDQTITAVANKNQAIKNNDQLSFDYHNFNSLAELYHSFATDSKGAEYINHILDFEHNLERTNLQRQNDIVNGAEMTPQMQYEKNLQYLEHLKKAYNQVEKYHNDISLLNIDRTDKDAVHIGQAYTEASKKTMYNLLANDIFFKSQLNDATVRYNQLDAIKSINQTTLIEDKEMADLKSNMDILKSTIDTNKKIYDTVASQENFKSVFPKWQEQFQQKKQEPEAKQTNTTQETSEQKFDASKPFYTNKEGVQENVQLNREYTLSDDAKAKVVDKFTEEPTGESIPKFTVEDHNGNNIGEFDTKEEAKKVADEFNEKLQSKKKLQVTGINLDGTLKVKYQNPSEEGKEPSYNEQTFNIPANDLNGYSRVQTAQDILNKNKDNINNAQNVGQQKASGTQTGDYNNDKETLKASFFISAKKAAKWLFTSTITPSEEWNNGVPENIQRSRIFSNNFDSFDMDVKSKTNIILVTPNAADSLGLSPLFEEAYKNSPTMSEEEKASTILAVYVKKTSPETHEFLNKEGKIAKDPSEYVYEFMPTAKLTNSNNESRARQNEQTEAQYYAVEWEKYRNSLLAFKEWNKQYYPFTFSQGITQESDENHSVYSVIKDNNFTITVPSTGTITNAQGENIKVPNGRPILKTGTSLIPLYNQTFTKEKAETIYNVFEKLAQEAIDKSSTNFSFDQNYTDFLNGILFWTKGITKGANAFTISGDTLFLGSDKKSPSLAIPLAEIANYKEQIIKKLQETYSNTNNKYLSSSEPFYEYDKDLNLIKWDSYKEYLTSHNYPDGTTRPINEIPLTLRVTPPSSSLPYAIRQKYAILQGIELTPKPEKQTATKQTTPTEQKETPKENIPTITMTSLFTDYNLNGVNNYSTSKGNIKFEIKDGSIIIVDGDPETENVIGILKNQDESIDDAKNRMLKKFIFRDYVNAKKAYEKSQESKTTEQPISTETPVTPVDLKSLKKTSNTGDEEIPDNRVVGIDGTERMTAEDLEIFKKWHQENVPNIPFEVLENIISLNDGKRAWGVFENNVAKFYKSALKGTEYHEIFEAVYKGFLNPVQRQELLDEFKSREGAFKDRETGKEILFAEATDRQAKERIADDFADFRIGKLPARSLKEKVLKFFRNIIEFVKSFINKPSKKDELFKAIDSGKFKEYTLTPLSNQNQFTETRAIGDLSEQQINDMVQDITSLVGNIIFEKEDYYNPEKIDSSDVFDRIKNIYAKKGIFDILTEEQYNQVVDRAKDNLRVAISVKFNEDEPDIENKTQNEYSRDPFTFDFKKSAKSAIKILMSLLPKTLRDKPNPLSLPKLDESSSVNGRKLLNRSQTFGTVLNRTANLYKLEDIVGKIYELANDDNDYVRLFTRLGGNLSTGTLNFSNFNREKWRLLTDFVQTFSKQQPDALIQYKQNGELYIAPANLRQSTDVIKRNWMEAMKQLSKSPEAIIKYNTSTKDYSIDKENLEKYKNIKTGPQQLEFLNKLGIDISPENYNKIKDVNTFSNQVSAIYDTLSKTSTFDAIRGKILGVESRLTNLANLIVKAINPNVDSTFRNLEGKQMQSFVENNVPSIFESSFNTSNTLEELIQQRPELQDTFSQNSVILKKGGNFFDKNGKRINTLKVSYIIGTDDVTNNKQKSTSSLTLGDRIVQELNQNLKGNYYVLIPADGSTEWMLNLGNSISYKSIRIGDTDSVYKTFQGYLKDDINLALSYKNDERVNLLNTRKNKLELRFFKEILSDDILNNINAMIASDETHDFNSYIELNKDRINKDIDKFIDSLIEQYKKELINTSQLIQGEDTYSFNNLLDDFAKENGLKKERLSEIELNNFLKFSRINNFINNVELHKILFGDPFQFAIKEKNGITVLDETKRIKSFLSPRRTTFDHPLFNDFNNIDYNKTLNRTSIPATDKNNNPFPGYYEFKPYLNTSVIKDVIIKGSISNSNLSKEIKDVYAKTNEADAASIISDNSYRDIKIRNGQWDSKAEEWHQWHQAYTRQALSKKGLFSYDGYKSIEEEDRELLEKPEPKYTIEIIKPIVTGNTFLTPYFNQNLHKMSQLPLYYKMAEGKNLENLYIKMMKENINYVVMESGAKEGIQDMHSLYTEDSRFNDASFNNRIAIPWSAYGIQVETLYDEKSKGVSGSQITKISSMDIFDNGKAKHSDLENLYFHNTEILRQMISEGYTSLLNKLGIKDTGSNFIIEDKIKLSETLKNEMLRREFSQNLKDTVDLNENNEFITPFEASPAYQQIRNLIYSMVNKAIVQRKTTGGSYIQAPVTLWEDASKGRRVEIVNGKPVLTDDTLQFYEDKDGKRVCEIMIPHWFKNQFKNLTDEQILDKINKSDKSILNGIGFRIPTQALSSIEVFKVKGFLPQFMGKTVVVPSEITSKAGSDFDVDKLNLFLKSIYIDKNNNIRLIDYKGSESATKEFYGKVFDELTQNKEIKINEIFDAAHILNHDLDDPKNLVDKYAYILDELDPSTIEDFADKKMQELEKFNDKDEQEKLRNEFINEKYRQALHNEYYTSLEQILTHPSNFTSLLTPIGDANLKAVSEELNKLKGKEDTDIKNKVVNGLYLTKLRQAFLTGKKWVGIAAVNITGHSNAQKTSIVIDKNIAKNIPSQDLKFLGNFEILIPHNSIDGKPTLSSINSIKGNKISDRLSGYATSFVDVAKDPYILDVIKSDRIIGTAMFLERIGCDEYGIKLLNQPIVDKYIDYLDANNVTSLYNQDSIDNFLKLFPTEINEIEKLIFNNNEEFKKELSLTKLNSFIKEYNGKNDNIYNAIQQLILSEVLKYTKMADYSFALTQATNYDTTVFNSGDAFFQKQLRTQEALTNNIFSNIDDLLNKTFLSHQINTLDNAMEAMSSIFKTESSEFTSITNQVLTPFANNKYLSKEAFQRIANKIKSSFLDYSVQIKSGLNEEIHSLLVNPDTNIATQLETLKLKYPQIQILQDLQIDSSQFQEGAKTIRLKVNLRNAYDEDLYTGMMRELRDNKETNQFYNNIVKVAILQGVYHTPTSISNIIPIEDYSNIVAPIINNLSATEDIQEFVKGHFYKNNWKDEDIFPTFTPKAIEVGEVFENSIDVDPKTQYIFSNFKNIDPLNIKGVDRRIMYVSAFNSASNKEFLKVPRILNINGEQVDFLTGRSIFARDFAIMKQKGDKSLYQVFGYQRVKYQMTDEPLAYTDEDNKTHYVYKLINLYGEYPFTTEYNPYNTPSQLDNGTIKINNEMPDYNIINVFGGEKPVVILPKEDISVYLPNEKVQKEENFVTWQLGKLEGTPQTKAKQQEVNDTLINNPEQSIYDGESFDQFSKRVIDTIQNIIDFSPNNTAILTHNTAFGLIKLWDEKNRLDFLPKDRNLFNTDAEYNLHLTKGFDFRTEYTKQDAKTGEFFKIQGKNGDIYIIRHGETTDNASNFFRTRGAELTEKGIQEAIEIGKKLSSIPIDKIYSSPLRRALYTANLIMSQQEIKKNTIPKLNKDGFPDKKLDIKDKC